MSTPVEQSKYEYGSDTAAHEIMQAFYLSPYYDPKCETPAHKVEAAIAFARHRLAHNKAAGAVREAANLLLSECDPQDGAIYAPSKDACDDLREAIALPPLDGEEPL